MTALVTQQKQVYAAEATTSRGRTLDSIKEVQDWVDSFRDLPWWEDLAPRVYRIEAYTIKGRSQGDWNEDAGAGMIELTTFDEHLILHEVAHVIANSMSADGSAGHGPRWVRTFLLLTFHLRGHEAWSALRQAFLDRGVVIDPKDDQ